MLKLKKVLLSFMVAAIAVAGFVSCANDDDEETVIVKDTNTYCTVSYSTDYGFAPTAVTVAKDTVLTSSLLPTLNDVTSANVQREFLGWYDADTDSYVNTGITKITKDLNLKAAWKTSLITDADKSVFYGKSYLVSFVDTSDGQQYQGVIDIKDENSIEFTSQKYFVICDKVQWTHRTTTDWGWTAYAKDSSDTSNPSVAGAPSIQFDFGITPKASIRLVDILTYPYSEQDEQTEAASLASLENAYQIYTRERYQSVSLKEDPTSTSSYLTLTDAPAMLSCYIDAMGGVEFGHAIFKDASFKNNNGNITCTLKTGIGVGFVFGGASPARVYIEPSIKSISDDTYSTPKYYSASHSLVDADYTVSTTEFGIRTVIDTSNPYNSEAGAEKVYAVDSITFPVSKDQTEYNLWFYLNSQIMGVQFCDGSGASSANHPNEATPYAATLTIDWGKVVFE